MYVVSLSRTVDGFWIETGPAFVEEGHDFDAVASRVRDALSASQSGVPTPPRDSMGSRLPELSGLRSYGSFIKGTVSVDVTSEDGRIVLTPMRNGGARAGFHFKSDKAMTVADDDLPSGLRRAFREAE